MRIVSNRIPWDENQLLKSFNRRSAKAMEEIFHRHWKRQLNMAQQLTNFDRETVEDIVQEVLIKLFNQDIQFNSIGHIDNFIYYAVRMRCIDRHRAIKRLKANREEWEYLKDPEDDIHFEQAIIRAEVFNLLSQEINKLAPQQRKVLDSFKEGKSTKEIAREMGISTRAVNSYRQAAIAILKGRLPDSAHLILLYIYLANATARTPAANNNLYNGSPISSVVQVCQ